MDDKKKKNKVGNLLTELRKKGEIVNKGGIGTSKWVVS